MWCYLVTPYAVSAGMTMSALRQALMLTTGTMTRATTTWTTCKGYAMSAIPVRPIEIWAAEWLTAAMLRATRLILSIIGTKNHQQPRADNRPSPLAHENALGRF